MGNVMGTQAPSPELTVTAARPIGLMVTICFLVAFLEGFDIQVLGIALGRLTAQFSLTGSQRTLLMTIGSLGIVLGAFVGGRIADFLGRKPLLLSAVAGFGLFTLGSVVATGFVMLVVCRALAGVGFGAALPMLMAIAADIGPPQRRASTAALIFCGMPAGGGSGGLLVQCLGADFDWRLLFAIGGVLPLLLFPAIAKILPETGGRRQTQSRSPLALMQALFGGERLGLTLLLWMVFLPTLTILYLILNWLPTLMAAKGFSGTVPALATMLFNYGSVIGAWVFGRWVDRFGVRGPLGFSYAALILCLLALGATTGVSVTLWLCALTGFLLLGANYAMYGVAAACYPPAVRGTGSGACVSVGRMGAVLGPMLAGIWLGGGASASRVIVYMAPFAALALMAVYGLGSRGAGQAGESDTTP